MIATIASDVLNGLEYLHKHDTMHRYSRLLPWTLEPGMLR